MRNVLIWCIDSSGGVNYTRTRIGNDWIHCLEGVPDREFVSRWGGMEFHTLIAVPELLETLKDNEAAKYIRSRCRYSSHHSDYREVFPSRQSLKG